jgi:thymidylate synthase (FAD)
MRHDHSSPFEFASIVLHIRAPLFVARQWYRHRTASVNEISGRYVELPHEHYVPRELHVRPTLSKQGRADEKPDEHDALRRKMTQAMKQSASVYRELIDANVAPELARIALPMGTYTEWYWKMDLRNLLHFLRLRLHHTAQQEITAYARCIGHEIVQHWAPLTWEAFCDYQLNGFYLSKPMYRCLVAHLKGLALTQEESGLSKGEWREWEEMLRGVED